MKIEVRVFATYRKIVSKHMGITADKVFYLEVPEGSTLANLLVIVGLGNEKVVIPLINGLRQDLDYQLKAGDRVGIFPPVGGG